MLDLELEDSLVVLEASAKKLCELRGEDPNKLMPMLSAGLNPNFGKFRHHVTEGGWTYLWVLTTLEILNHIQLNKALEHGIRVLYNQTIEESGPAPF
jgi:hypothetical protein